MIRLLTKSPNTVKNQIEDKQNAANYKQISANFMLRNKNANLDFNPLIDRNNNSH